MKATDLHRHIHARRHECRGATRLTGDEIARRARRLVSAADDALAVCRKHERRLSLARSIGDRIGEVLAVALIVGVLFVMHWIGG